MLIIIHFLGRKYHIWIKNIHFPQETKIILVTFPSIKKLLFLKEPEGYDFKIVASIFESIIFPYRGDATGGNTSLTRCMIYAHTGMDAGCNWIKLSVDWLLAEILSLVSFDGKIIGVKRLTPIGRLQA